MTREVKQSTANGTARQAVQEMGEDVVPQPIHIQDEELVNLLADLSQAMAQAQQIVAARTDAFNRTLAYARQRYRVPVGWRFGNVAGGIGFVPPDQE
jgi:hypothetical protein